MWNKPEVKQPNFSQHNVTELNSKETMEVNGGKVGTCLGLGYTCDTSSGGLKVGTCASIGYSCDTRKGGF